LRQEITMSWRIPAFTLVLAASIAGGLRAQNAKPQSSLSISFPGKTWALKIDSPDFAIESSGRQPDGREYLLANNSKTGIIASVTLEQSPGGADNKTCPDFLRKRVDSMSQLGPTDVKASEINSMAAIEVLLPKPQGIPLQQKNFFVCAAKDDIYVDIHLSKVQFQPSDEPLFTDVLSHVQIIDRTDAAEPKPTAGSSVSPVNSGSTSMDYFRDGSRYYVANDFKNAIGPYQRALDLEKQHSELSSNYWRVLVDNLGMAYGVTNDLNHAEETFNYGISKDPSYPMFYYNLACVSAQRNDMNKTMGFLRKAFALKANAIPGEGMPDPRQDDSFQRFMSTESFRKFADSLMAP
jgi:hypothetical protein